MKINQEMYLPLLGVFVIGILVGLYIIPTQQASANDNGPFVIVPGDATVDLQEKTSQVCGAGAMGATVCCNYVRMKAIECAGTGGNNCRTMDLNSGTCEYDYRNLDAQNNFVISGNGIELSTLGLEKCVVGTSGNYIDCQGAAVNWCQSHPDGKINDLYGDQVPGTCAEI